MTPYNQFPDSSRVWIYQSNRPFSQKQTDFVRQKLQHFIAQWQSHGAMVKGWADVKYDRFIILMVDENHEAPSGCSIDSSVAVIKEIELELGVDLFDRMNFAYKIDATTVHSASRNDFANLYASKEIGDQTIVFNNLVNTKVDLENKWEIPLSNSWHARMV